MWTNFASHCIWHSIKSLKKTCYTLRDVVTVFLEQICCQLLVPAEQPVFLSRPILLLHWIEFGRSTLFFCCWTQPIQSGPFPLALFFFSTHPPISHSISSIQGDASPSHPAPFNSVHCVHFIPAPIPRIFRILGETLRILRTQRARSFIKPKPRGHPGVGRVLPDAVATPIRGEVRELIHIEANESR